MDQPFRFAVSIPWFSDVPVGGQQAVADQESSARHASANRRGLIGKTNLVDAVNIADGIPVTVQHQRGHSLLSLELCHLLG